jgi:hypothetical protein
VELGDLLVGMGGGLLLFGALFWGLMGGFQEDFVYLSINFGGIWDLIRILL